MNIVQRRLLEGLSTVNDDRAEQPSTDTGLYRLGFLNRSALARSRREEISKLAGSMNLGFRPVVASVTAALLPTILRRTATALGVGQHALDDVVRHVAGRSAAQSRWLASVGTAGPEQKVHITLFDESLHPRTHVKLALGTAAGAGILREISALEAVSSRVPTAPVVCTKKWGNTPVLAVSFLKQAQRVTLSELLPTLAALQCDGSVRLTDVTALRNLHRLPALIPSSFAADVAFLRTTSERFWTTASNATLQAAIVHGDFAPWNVREDSEQPILVDWEHSAPGVVSWDALHWVVQTASLLRRVSPRRAVDLILSARADPGLAAIFECHGVGRALRSHLLRGYLLARILYTSELNANHDFDRTGQQTHIGYWISMLRRLDERHD